MHTPALPDTSGEIVFAPVPTREEMLAITRQVQQARAGRARLLIVVVFLAGIIAAGVMAIAFIRQNSAETVAQAEADLTLLTRRLSERDAEIAQLKGQLKDLTAELDGYAGFRSITALEAQSKRLEADIKTLLAEPSRRDAPARLRELPSSVEWLDGVVSRLAARRDRLESLKSEVQSWPPRPVAPRPD